MRVLSTLLLFTLIPSAYCQEPKSNTLTPKEIADGWILLFDGETTFGWNVRGDARVDKGDLVLRGDKKSTDLVNTTRFPPHELKISTRTSSTADWFSRHDSSSARLINLSSNIPAFFVRDVKLKPVDMKPLFNGKDLTGWKVFPGKKSVFTVEDGTIRIKDGPGDLQTEGKYGDFMLQLECKVNGKHLNSGVFFRCRDGEYQNGYEAQIRNQFTAEPTQEYAVEEYDPKTNKLLDKKKVKSTAFDYGTGAIYRRVPARKEVARDGEWFTMTVVAHGNHIATWVNGIQVVDWTDNRPRSDNARTGCRLEPGHISFQGHDPTTDLSFRNIRIAELPK